MDIFTLLKLKNNTSKEVIKEEYYKKLFEWHPRTKLTGNDDKFIALQNAYKRYVLGDDFLNCFQISCNTIEELYCRCGSKYQFQKEFVGTVECDSCSCFIILEEPSLMLSSISLA